MALVKLKLQSFESPVCSGNPVKTIYAVVNPENYTKDFAINYGKPKVQGNSAQTLFFSDVGDDTLTLSKLIIDGTGVIPLEGADDVDDYIQMLEAVVYKYDGNMHSPPYVKITWGNLIFKGVCISFKTNYQLFKPDGKALRATVDIVFKSTIDPKTKAQQANNKSSDLTHMRTVKGGDTLPLMTYRIYGDSSYYLEVAKANGLDNIHAIKPGDQIYFPPLKK